MRQLVILILCALLSYPTFAKETINIPILCYHNFNPVKPGSMNLRPQKFTEQIEWLKNHGFTVISLQAAMDYLSGKRATLPSKPVVITADDGWQSDYTYLYPIAKKYNIPVTLFIYPATISNGKNSLTWQQLKELQNTGLFDIQSHTYGHPNFKQAKKTMSPIHFEKYVAAELAKSKGILEEKLGIKVNALAWPFGIYNEYLEHAASKAGYTMAFTIDHRKANKSFRDMAQPRFMILESQPMKAFAGYVN